MTRDIFLSKVDTILWQHQESGLLAAVPGTLPGLRCWRLYIWWDLVISDTQKCKMLELIHMQRKPWIMCLCNSEVFWNWLAYQDGDDDELRNSSCSSLTNSGVWRGRTWSMSNSSSSCNKKHCQSSLTYLNHTQTNTEEGNKDREILGVRDQT
jgi:hypothetical protein